MVDAISPNFSIEVPNSATTSSGTIRRSYKENIQGHISFKGSFTCFESFQRSAKLYGDNPCLGERVVDSFGNAGPFVFSSYAEVAAMRCNFASGLSYHKIISPTSDGSSLLGILLKNCTKWIIAEQACYYLNITTVPFFDSTKADTIKFIINQTELQTVLCSVEEFYKVLTIAHQCPTLSCIILTCPVISKDIQRDLISSGVNLKLITWNEIIYNGSLYPIPPRPPSSNSIATFCYTSGTTGQPKGALISHQNLIVVMTGGLESGIPLVSSDSYLSFLPLPHIFERLVVTALLSTGGMVGFFRGDPLGIIDDLKALRPSIFCAVPRLLNKIRDKVVQTGSNAPGMKGRIFRQALNTKLENFQSSSKNHLVHHWLWDPLVFQPIRVALGLNRVRKLLSGAAPLPVDTAQFFKILLGKEATCHEGYGQTETCGATTMTDAEDTSTGTVGSPFPSLDIKLVDVPALGYFHTDSIHSDGTVCQGRGEICVRGPGVFQGYYKDPIATAAAIDTAGWLHSGDVGMWTTLGQLVIIDRLKNIFKLSQGEFVAVERVEAILSRATLVGQIFVYGDSTRSALVAVVVPEEDTARKWAQQQGIQWTDKDSFQQLCRMESFKNSVLQELREVGVEGGLLGYELIKGVFLEHRPWVIDGSHEQNGGSGNNKQSIPSSEISSPGIGILTPTLKMKREAAKCVYQLEIDRLYYELQSQSSTTENVSVKSLVIKPSKL